MLRNFLKVAIRNLYRNKAFSLINIIGLSIGLAASIMIAMWVFDELSYDRFHSNADRIYRVERDIEYEGQSFVVPVTGAIYGPTIMHDFPEVINMVKVDPASLSIEDKNKTRYNEMVYYVDTSFFQVFSFPLKTGDPKTALKEPHSLVLSEKAARKFFGDENPMNQVLRIDKDGEMIPYKITGILEKLPSNKHFQFDILGSFSTLETDYSKEQLNTWLSNYLYTYVLLANATDKSVTEQKFSRIVEEKILPAYETYFKSEGTNDNSLKVFC